MNLKEAREKNNLAQFVRERQKETPANRRTFNRVVKAMVSQTSSPMKGTSQKGSRAS